MLCRDCMHMRIDWAHVVGTSGTLWSPKMERRTATAFAVITSSGKPSNFTASSPAQEVTHTQFRTSTGACQYEAPPTCQQSNEDGGVAEVPEHEELSTRHGSRGNMAEEVYMRVPEPLLKAEHHLQQSTPSHIAHPPPPRPPAR